jgi:DNA-binding FadR family transcriptional regulator
MSDLIVKRSLADEVASKLKEQIILGQYKVNEKLPIEPELMKKVWRWPVNHPRSH